MPSLSLLALAAAACALAAADATAQLYRWKDAAGRIHYSNVPSSTSRAAVPAGGAAVLPTSPVAPPPAKPAPADAAGPVAAVPTASAAAAPVPAAGPVAAAPAAAVRDPVVMYSTAWCGYCAQARRYFTANRIPFVEKDIEQSAAVYQEFKQQGGRGVPLILVGTQKMSGFGAARLAQMLSAAGY